MLLFAAPLQAQSLTDLLARAAVSNQLPPTLATYTAQVESEIAIIARREDGTEATAAIEQVASRVHWSRTGTFDQTVIGYRNQQVGANVSLLSLLQTGWLNPVLYGNRVRIRARTGGNRVRRPGSIGSRNDGADTLPAVHPLAADRERFYDYTGGDTTVVIRAGDRTLPILHVRVRPKASVPTDVVLFDGEMELDASRGALVRLRGHFVRRGSTPRGALAVALGDAVAFVEYENGERLGAYWLPARQRIELQAAIPALGDTRAVVRIVSRFREMVVAERTVVAADSARRADSVQTVGQAALRRRFTVLSSDSLQRFDAWAQTIGALSAGMHADDFNDVAPDRWRSTGPPRWEFTAPRPSDVFHYNRVEGAYTGAGVLWALRDAAPGVAVRANAGYAWGERTVRGRVEVARTRGATTLALRGGRSLDNTNDFRTPFDSGNTFGALFGSVDPYDYVSRSRAVLAVAHRVGNDVERRQALVRAEFGVSDDQWRPVTQQRGLFGREPFRENRGADNGRSLHSALTLEWHPDRAPEFVSPGASARVIVERGDALTTNAPDFTRVEGRLTWRRLIGPFTWLARSDAGVVVANDRTNPRIAPQQLFELGQYQNLPGYADKQFAGSRAVSLRSSVQYVTPWWRTPIRLTSRLWLPALSPGVSFGVQAGWADAPSPAARAAMQRLDTRPVDPLVLYAPLVTTTGRMRASVTAGLRLFGNGLFLGATRPVDQAAPWKALVGFGQVW